MVKKYKIADIVLVGGVVKRGYSMHDIDVKIIYNSYTELISIIKSIIAKELNLSDNFIIRFRPVGDCKCIEVGKLIIKLK